MFFSIESDLVCQWPVRTGKLTSLYGKAHSTAAISLAYCKSLCSSTLEFICVASNYELNTGTCELLVEDETSASFETVQGWIHVSRPPCDGKVIVNLAHTTAYSKESRFRDIILHINFELSCYIKYMYQFIISQLITCGSVR